MEVRAQQHEAHFEVRENGEDRIIEGYFAVFGERYDMGWGMSEEIAPTAFDESINGDVRALINHDKKLVLGRTTASTLTLRKDNHGLWGTIKINKEDQDALNVWARVKRRDVSQASFGFIEQECERVVDRSKGTVHFVQKKVLLKEVTVCTFAAYESTSLSARDSDETAQRRMKAWKEFQKERFEKWGH